MLQEHAPFRCWICGTHISLEHCITDEHGLGVHESCQTKRILRKAASVQADAWRQALQPERDAA